MSISINKKRKFLIEKRIVHNLNYSLENKSYLEKICVKGKIILSNEDYLQGENQTNIKLFSVMKNLILVYHNSIRFSIFVYFFILLLLIAKIVSLEFINLNISKKIILILFDSYNYVISKFGCIYCLFKHNLNIGSLINNYKSRLGSNNRITDIVSNNFLLLIVIYLDIISILLKYNFLLIKVLSKIISTYLNKYCYFTKEKKLKKDLKPKEKMIRKKEMNII